MIYLFERDAEVIQVETRYRQGSKTFEITCRHDDGTVTHERFSGEASFRFRLEEIVRTLEKGAWHSAGAQLVEDGWKI